MSIGGQVRDLPPVLFFPSVRLSCALDLCAFFCILLMHIESDVCGQQKGMNLVSAGASIVQMYCESRRFRYLFAVRFLLVVPLLVVSSTWGQWSGLTNISGWSDRREVGPDIVADSQGNLHVVFFGGVDGDWRVWQVTRPVGAGWTAPVQISAGDSYICHCAIGPQDTLHITWEEDDEVYYRARYANGQLSAIVNLSNTAQRSLAPDIACDGLGRIFVAWHEDTVDARWEIYFRRNEGGVWLPSEQLTNDPEISAYVALESDAANNLHLTWTHDYLDILYRVRSSAGVWSAVENIAPAAGRSRDQRLAIGPGNIPHVVWHDDRDGGWDIYYAKRVGGIWQPVNLSAGFGVDSLEAHASVAVSAAGGVYVTFHRDYTDVYAAISSGGGFFLPERVTFTGQATASAICCDKFNLPHAAIQDKSNGTWDIVYTVRDPNWTPSPTPTRTVTPTPTRTNTPRNTVIGTATPTPLRDGSLILW